MNCDNCKVKLEKDASFCPNCGQPIKRPKRCFRPSSVTVFISIITFIVLCIAFGLKSKLPDKKTISSSNISEYTSDANTKILSDEELFEQFVQQYSFLYGKTFTGYLSKSMQNSRYDYDISSIPISNLAFDVYDFDNDQKDELLIISLNDDYTITLSMYEIQNNQVMLSDKIIPEYENEWTQDNSPISIINSLSYQNTKPGITDFYTYQTSKTQIGIEISDTANLLADGTNLLFLSVSYENNKFIKNGQAGYSGSDYNDYLVFNATKEYSDLGINVLWEDLVSRNTYVSDYVKNYRDIMKITTTYLTSLQQFQSWENSNNSESLPSSQLYFSLGMEEVESTENQETVQHYSEILDLYYCAIANHWDIETIQEADLAESLVEEIMYGVTLDNIGYSFIDVDKNGVDELFLMDIKAGSDDSIGSFHEMYTFDGIRPVKIASSYYRDRFYLCKNSVLKEISSGSANNSAIDVYSYNDTNLSLLETIFYDGYYNKDNPYFRTIKPSNYGCGDVNDYSNPISETEFYQIRDSYEQENLSVMPLSSYSYQSGVPIIETNSSEYILPQSSYQYLSENDLINLSQIELRLARNEIYAKHGRMFRDEELQNYFNSCSWYTPTISPDSFQDYLLNNFEKYNLKLISSYEKKLGYQ